MHYAHTVIPGTQVRLHDIDPNASGGLTKDEGRERFARFNATLDAMQEELYAAGVHALLLILQGMDTAGKDGAIRNVMQNLNPQGCRVESFKVPTEEELAHDFLWRVHKVVPRKGMVGVFNRSHYEDVLIVRVHSLVPEHVWRARYDQINESTARRVHYCRGAALTEEILLSGSDVCFAAHRTTLRFWRSLGAQRLSGAFLQ